MGSWGGVTLLVATILLSLFDIHIPFLGIGARETFAACFFFIGYRYRHSGMCLHRNIWVVPVGIGVVSFGAIFWQASLLDFTYLHIVPYTISALAGIFLVFHIACKTDDQNGRIKNFLCNAGNNTLVILTWHFLCFKLVSLLIILFYGLSIKRLAEFPVIEEYTHKGWFVVYFLVGVCVPLLFARTKYLR